MKLFLLFFLLPACKKEVPPPVAVAPLQAPVEAPPAPPPAPAPVQQMARNFERIHFDYNSAVLDDASRRMLDENASIMQDNPDIRIEVQGHADERGTTEYNIALGQKRASAVQQYLSQKGLSASRVKTVSYGEERPLDSGATETAWAQNRRAEFRITYGASSTIAGTTP